MPALPRSSLALFDGSLRRCQGLAFYSAPSARVWISAGWSLFKASNDCNSHMEWCFCPSLCSGVGLKASHSSLLSDRRPFFLSCRCKTEQCKNHWVLPQAVVAWSASQTEWKVWIITVMMRWACQKPSSPTPSLIRQFKLTACHTLHILMGSNDVCYPNICESPFIFVCL